MKHLILFCFSILHILTYSQVHLTKKVKFVTEFHTEFDIDTNSPFYGQKVYSVPDSVELFFAEVPADYKGGIPALEKLIVDSLKISSNNLEKSLKGKGNHTIKFAFTIDEKGILKDLRLIQGLIAEVDCQIERILRFGKWIAGETMARKVESKCTFAVTFSKK